MCPFGSASLNGFFVIATTILLLAPNKNAGCFGRRWVFQISRSYTISRPLWAGDENDDGMEAIFVS
jgi:hypothetical protein